MVPPEETPLAERLSCDAELSHRPARAATGRNARDSQFARTYAIDLNAAERQQSDFRRNTESDRRADRAEAAIDVDGTGCQRLESPSRAQRRTLFLRTLPLR